MIDSLRPAAVAFLDLTPATRLISIGTGGWVDAAALDCYVAVEAGAGDGPRAVVGDPLRLPFVEAVADGVLAQFGPDDEPHARLREIWRILAPAGILVVAVPWPARHGWGDAVRHRLIRRHVARSLAAALFAVEAWVPASDGLAVRAVKSDGLAPQRVTRTRVRTVTAPAG